MDVMEHIECRLEKVCDNRNIGYRYKRFFTRKPNVRFFDCINMEDGECICTIPIHYTKIPTIEPSYKIEKEIIYSDKGLFHIYSRYDLLLGKCSQFDIGEIERTDLDYPITYFKFTLFQNIPFCNLPQLEKIIEEGFIEIDAPNVQEKLDICNLGSKHCINVAEKTLRQKEKELKNQGISWDEYINTTRNDSGIDYSEEDVIMWALSNGEGDRFGY